MTGQLQDRYNRVTQTNIACAFFDHSTNVLSVSYTVHIHFVCYTSVTRTLVDNSLSVTCLAHMRSLRLLQRLPSPDKHFLHFSVRLASVTFIRLYVTAPLICDSTIKVHIKKAVCFYCLLRNFEASLRTVKVHTVCVYTYVKQ